jgi:hypothetical protein
MYIDCEGAGEMFRVTTLPTGGSDCVSDCGNNGNSENSDNITNKKEKEVVVRTKPSSKALTDADDFFGKPTFLTVSGQVIALQVIC